MEITHLKEKKADLEIKDISLLTVEEAEQLPVKIRRYDDWWWLKTAGADTTYAADVSYNGFVIRNGCLIDTECIAVRPVLTINNLDSLKPKLGESLIIQKKKYLYIGNNKALYDDKRVYCIFDEETNDYEKSHIKQVVDKWLEK